jgi:hypothetical protein
MDQKIVGIVGAIAGLATLGATQGTATATPNPEALKGAQSFAGLLDPIPNALAMLRAADSTAPRNQAEQTTDVRVAQNHHHHHHHRYVKPKRRHHHHHHHHHHND